MGRLGGEGGFLYLLDLQNIHRKEHCSDNIITTTTHPLPMSTPFKPDLQSSSSGHQQSKKEIKRQINRGAVSSIICNIIFYVNTYIKISILKKQSSKMS